MKIVNRFVLFLALTIVFPQLLICQSSIENVIPNNWKIVKTINVPQEKISSFNSKLGVEAVTITNDFIEVGADGIQINIVHCKTEKGAEIVYKKLVALHKSEEKLLMSGKAVYEFRSLNMDLIKKAKSIFKIE